MRVVQDWWAWHYEKTGYFSVRSCYRLLAMTKKVREDWLEGRQSSSSASLEQKQWCSLWKTQVPGKIRVFLWRLAHNSIPTGYVRCNRSMAPTSVCGLCHAGEDDWRHSLLDCNSSRCVWALLDDELVEHMTTNHCSNAKEWLFLLDRKSTRLNSTHPL